MRVYLAAALIVTAIPAFAQEPLDGFFIAQRVCDAFQSKNRMTNPGDIQTEEMRAYEIIGINKAGGDFYQVRIPGAPVTEDRWVHISCGVHVVDSGTGSGAVPADGGDISLETGPESTDNLLTLSWQPAFCETRPAKEECLALNGGQLPITETQLSLHGLWPQPNGKFFCGVPQSIENLDRPSMWDQLPEPEIDADTREALNVVMPGTASFLERHEWIKHGTCYKAEGGADEYFDDTLRLVDRINDSPIAAFLASHVGGEVDALEIRALFDQEFGDGAGDRVQVHCTGDGGRTLLVELWISLIGEITETPDLGALMLAADPVSAGCDRGVIDPAGEQ
ncbi:ribonuclease T [Pseudoruegeria sp. HB172150]|uniref:ribonuclease T2 family protein n=1 Tax=Pseudoruegeria sp. HB172150 TaxID=2721164 RepID=UPI0015536F38|nr:ribonuclease T [Pseudoruegeria sp. HB172150]